MKKSLLLSILCLWLTVSYTQDKSKENFTYGVNVSQSLTNTKYTEISALVGVESKGDEVMAGPLYRKLYGDNGHSNDYYGGTLYGQTGIFYPLIIFLKSDFVYGSWYKQDQYSLKISENKKLEMMPTVGVGYALNKNINATVGYNYFVYDPQDYVKTGVSAFQNHGVVLGLKYTVH